MIKICPHCGEKFESTVSQKFYCSEQCKKQHNHEKRKSQKHIPDIEFGCDFKIGQIAEIMHSEGITYEQYARNREYYARRANLWELNEA